MKTLSRLLLLAFSPALFAQTDSGSLRVLVEDPSQSAVYGAKVSLQNSGTGIRMESTSDGEGYAVFRTSAPNPSVIFGDAVRPRPIIECVPRASTG